MRHLLYKRGYKVYRLFDYGKNYRSFKNLTQSEIDAKLKQKYYRTLFILKVSAIALVATAICAVIFS
jgi:hypothetical protein